MTTITASTYDLLDKAFTFFNERLWAGQLPATAILLHRKRGAYGYFGPDRIGLKGGGAAHEIALNPDTFEERGVREVLGTLVHEMAHLWQQVYGDPTRGGYHNKEWAAEMKRVGLIPSSTGEPGGKQTGQKVSHYIEDDGAFDLACEEFMNVNGDHLEWFSITIKNPDERAKKRASKTKYTCPSCDANAWAKPGSKLICGECEELMLAEDDPDLDYMREERRHAV